nr:immunoglobulin heavy chain junction region [Macaca mulatta]MPN69530.1 immunoglobulin heavy chain junction region [Macaca mulatta]MPN69999.1 immunoglobulin heavy chain junction region [Macaca mulatta]MPN70272.1 immunoglobulin heavy chain junction region [Macaca mulatta]MPN70401.1 immunoglobulin heavy chain junction region [Macaca mulatta]
CAGGVRGFSGSYWGFYGLDSW